MNFLLTALVARRRPTLNPPNDNEFDSPLLCARVLVAARTTANSAEDMSKEPKQSQQSAREEQQVEDQNNLTSRLSAYRKESSLRRPDFAKAYDELVARLNVIERGEVGPQLGEAMPQFSLPDENGRLVTLASLLRSGPVVISINRGHWCPYCKLDLRSLAEINGEIERLGARAIAIMPDSAEFTEGYASRNRLPFPLLSDIDLGYSLSLDLTFWVGDQIGELYRRAGVELEKYHRNHAYFLPMASKFIVGRDGLVKARQVDIEFRECMEPEAIITELLKLHSPA
jgi:peroxiredoxin